MWWLVACALAHPSPHSIVAGRRPQPHNDGMDEPAQCLVWRRAPVGMVLTTAPRPTRGTSCIPMSFHRFNQAEARELIARKRILLVGDSVASYWYLSLAHFLHSGDTLKEWDTSKRGHAHPLFEQYWSRIGKSWRGAQWWAWNTFYNGTSADFGGNEICDCYREPVSPSVCRRVTSATATFALVVRPASTSFPGLGTLSGPADTTSTRSIGLCTAVLTWKERSAGGAQQGVPRLGTRPTHPAQRMYLTHWRIDSTLISF